MKPGILALVVLTALVLGGCQPSGVGTTVSLEGTWDFWPHSFVLPDPTTPAPQQLKVPGAWNAAMGEAGRDEGTGYGTYRLRLDVPAHGVTPQGWGLRILKAGTAYQVFCDGRLVYRCGQPGSSPAESHPRYETALVPLLGPEASGPQTLNLVIQVSNFHDRDGGLWNQIRFGPLAELKRTTSLSLGWEYFLIGGFLVLGLYHLLFYLFMPRETAYLYIALVALAQGVYASVYSYCSLTALVPWLDWNLAFKLEYAAIVLSLVPVAGYLRRLFPLEFPLWTAQVLLGLGSVYLVFVLVAPPLVLSRGVWVVYVLLLATLVALGRCVLLSLLRRRQDSALLAAAIAVLAAVVPLDLLTVFLKIPHEGLSPLGALIGMVIQAKLLSGRFARNSQSVLRETEDLQVQNQRLESSNEAFRRFVPIQFLQYLDKEQIEQLTLGDQVSRPMTILFVRINNFAQITSQLPGSEVVGLLNHYYALMTPVIRRQGGFVDKFMTEQIMAIFDHRVDLALKTALGLQSVVTEENQKRRGRGEPELKLGIGLHCGPLSLGIIGEEGRMETTVVGDAVNLASRIEGLTQHFGAPILTTRSSLDLAEQQTRFAWRPVDRVPIRGKTQSVDLVEVLGEVSG